jgi:hypothetical protein
MVLASLLECRLKDDGREIPGLGVVLLTRSLPGILDQFGQRLQFVCGHHSFPFVGVVFV